MKIEFLNKDKKADFELVFVKDKNLKNLKGDFDFGNYDGSGEFLDIKNQKLFIGIESDYNSYANAIYKACKIFKKYNIKSFKCEFESLECEYRSVLFLAYGVLYSEYEFNKYKSKKDEKKPSLKEVYLINKKINENDANEALQNAKIIADGVSFTKDIINEIPSVYVSTSFEEDALKLAKKNKLECKVYSNDYLKQEGMNAFLAVNRASEHPAKLIHLTYKPKKSKKRIVYVGKGLTYDTGGLSLKPADFMRTMKADKSGASSVLGIIKIASELKLPYEIHAIIGATDNAIGPKSYKPDDILISREKVSIEVQNTDAEGRLVLADCLSYAQDLKPDLLFDMATLTGACVVGLGEYTTGLMGNNEELLADFYTKTKNSGDYACVLHFNPHLKELIKSKIADITNTASSRYGGAITAGLFLDNFIRKEYKDKWIHQDIAGPAYVEKEWGIHSFGASGAGIRLNIDYLLKLARSE